MRLYTQDQITNEKLKLKQESKAYTGHSAGQVINEIDFMQSLLMLSRMVCPKTESK